MTLQVESLTFTWPKTGFHLSLPHLHIAEGERVLLTAPSGSGKSTLLSLIAGLIPPQSGTITLAGQPMTGRSASQRDRLRADDIGFIFQSLNLLPYLSALENILLPLRFSPRRLKAAGGKSAALRQAQKMMQDIGLDPEKFAHLRADTLSIGQQQRIAALRALIGGPKLIIADEPTSALDTEARAQFIELLFAQSAQSQAAVLMVSHDLALAPLFERRLNLNDIATVERPA